MTKKNTADLAELKLTTGLVIGATGLLGPGLLAGLDKQKLRYDVFARNPKALSAPLGRIFSGDLQDQQALRNAMSGKAWVVYVPTNTKDKIQHAKNIAAAAKASGVSLIIKTSAILTGETPPESFGIEHLPAEHAIEQSGCDWVILRPPFFMQTFKLFAHVIHNKNKIILPVKSGATAFIDTYDIGECVAKCVVDAQRYVGKIVTITGPEALTMSEVAGLFSNATGRNIGYLSPPAFIAGLALRWGEKQDPWTVKRMLQLFRAIRQGKEARITTRVEEMLGRPACRFVEFLKRDDDAKNLWQ